MDTQSLIAASQEVALDTVPASGSVHSGTILQIFENNRGKKFSAKILKGLFESQGIEVDKISNVLFALRKQGKITRVQSGWYTLE